MYDPLGINKKYDPLNLEADTAKKYDPLGLEAESVKRYDMLNLESPAQEQPTQRLGAFHKDLMKSPNVYAAVKTAEDMTPYAKYIDPEERDRFMKLSTNKQVRELLYEDLNLAVATIALPNIGKAVSNVVGPAMKRFLPKTYEFFTKEIGSKASLGRGATGEPPSSAPPDVSKAPGQVRHDPLGINKTETVNEIAGKFAEGRPKTALAGEAWEMTRDEYAEVVRISLGGKSRVLDSMDLGYVKGKHRKQIEQALSEGKPVPKSVLKDYPDLKPTTTSVTKPTAGEAPTRDFFEKTGGSKGESGQISLEGKTPAQIKIQPNTPASKVEGMFDRTYTEAVNREKLTVGKVRDAFVKGFVDVSGNLKREALKIDPVLGRNVVMDRELLSGAVPKAVGIIEESRPKIWGELNVSEQELLNRVVQSRRTIAIDKYKPGMKHPDGLGGVEHQQYLDDLAKNDPATFKKVSAAADNYFGVMKSQLDDLLKEGLITPEQHVSLAKHEYSPRQFMQYLDPVETFSVGGKKISVANSGIKSLDEGSLKLLDNDSERLLNEVVTRTQSRIFKNKANRSLLDFAEANPNNLLVKPAEIIRTTKKGVPVFQDAPAGFDKISVMIEGKKREMIMPSKMAEEWVKSDPLINETLGSIIGWASGAKPLKAVATGYNPAFALSNIPRDVGLIWSATTEYSKHLPVAIGQLAKDFIKVAPDVMKRTGRVKDYMNEGGGMQFLTYYGRFSGKGFAGEKLNSLEKIMGWVGETSEIWSRLALRERAITNGASSKEATWIARRYLDFSQGGNIAKGLDTGLPYLNAAAQGTRGFLRGAKQNPGVFTYKMAQLGTVSTSLYLANRSNPECWNQISDREKEANFIITTPFSYVDERGQKRYYYGKIAKDQSQRVVTSLFDATMARYHEGKFPTKQVMMAWGDLLNVPLPPTISAYVAYAGNLDTWTMEDVWKGPEVNPQEEWRPGQTSKTMQKFGEVTGLSPERTKGAMNKVIPASNPFFGLVGGGLAMITGEMEEEIRDKTMAQLLAQNPSIRRVLASTNPNFKGKDDIEQKKTDENTRRFVQRRDLDALTDKFFKTNDEQTKAEIFNYVQKQPEADRERLIDNIMTRKQLDKIPDRTWWINIKTLSPEVRADVYWDRYKQATPEEQAQMAKTATQISGVLSDRFVSRLIKLKKENMD